MGGGIKKKDNICNTLRLVSLPVNGWVFAETKATIGYKAEVAGGGGNWRAIEWIMVGGSDTA